MKVYSHSQLSVYEECPHKYKLQYLDKIKPEAEVEGIEGFMGNRVHETLKKCYDGVKCTKLNSLPDLLTFYHQQWDKNWHDGIVIARAELTAENYRALGARALENYYNRYVPFDQDRTIATEKPITFSLDADGKYRIRGFIDRLARGKDGAFEIHDYKTSSHLPTQEDADGDRQLALYQIGVQRCWPQVRQVRLVWHYLAFDTELVSTRSDAAMRSLIQDTSRLIDEIESAKDFPARESFLCNWCDYPDRCPHKAHEQKVAGLPVNEYLAEPGVALVNKFAALKSQSDLIGAEMEKVKEAIIEYARRNGTTRIQGSNRHASIRFSKKLGFPRKNEAFREDLEQIIVGAGKWDEVSQLDVYALARACENRSWGRELIERVMKYGRMEETTVVNLSRQKEDTFAD